MDSVINPDLTEKTALSEKEQKPQTIRPGERAERIKVPNIYDWTSVRLAEFYLFRFMDRAAKIHKSAKKERGQHSSVWTEQAKFNKEFAIMTVLNLMTN